MNYFWSNTVISFVTFLKRQKYTTNFWLYCQGLCLKFYCPFLLFFFNLQAHIYASEYVNPNKTLPEDISICSLFLANIDEHKTVSIQIFGKTYSLPPWSVSILPDCKTVAYNTAKVTVTYFIIFFVRNVLQEKN